MHLVVGWHAKLIINHVGNHFRYYNRVIDVRRTRDTTQTQQVSILPCPR